MSSKISNDSHSPLSQMTSDLNKIASSVKVQGRYISKPLDNKTEGKAGFSKIKQQISNVMHNIEKFFHGVSGRNSKTAMKSLEENVKALGEISSKIKDSQDFHLIHKNINKIMKTCLKLKKTDVNKQELRELSKEILILETEMKNLEQLVKMPKNNEDIPVALDASQEAVPEGDDTTTVQQSRTAEIEEKEKVSEFNEALSDQPTLISKEEEEFRHAETLGKDLRLKQEELKKIRGEIRELRSKESNILFLPIAALTTALEEFVKIAKDEGVVDSLGKHLGLSSTDNKQLIALMEPLKYRHLSYRDTKEARKKADEIFELVIKGLVQSGKAERLSPNLPSLFNVDIKNEYSTLKEKFERAKIAYDSLID